MIMIILNDIGVFIIIIMIIQVVLYYLLFNLRHSIVFLLSFSFYIFWSSASIINIVEKSALFIKLFYKYIVNLFLCRLIFEEKEQCKSYVSLIETHDYSN